MSRTRPELAVALLLLALVACKKKPPAVADAGPEPVVEQADANAADPHAANAANVARFGDETKMDHVAATILAQSAQVHEDPAGGKLFATLVKGAAVVQLAEHEGHILIAFDNPKNASEKLLGWVRKDAFTAGAGHVTRPAPSDGGAKDAAATPAPAAKDAGIKAGLKTGIGF